MKYVILYIYIYIIFTYIRTLIFLCVWVPAAQKILLVQDIDIVVVLTRIMERVNFKVFETSVTFRHMNQYAESFCDS